jgi:hypothetical protein
MPLLTRYAIYWPSRELNSERVRRLRRAADRSAGIVHLPVSSCTPGSEALPDVANETIDKRSRQSLNLEDGQNHA